MKTTTHEAWMLALVVVLGLVITAVAGWRVGQIEHQRNAALLDSRAEQAIGEITSRTAQLQTLLNSLNAYVQQAAEIDREPLMQFVRTLAQSQPLTGAQALYWIPRVADEDWPQLQHELGSLVTLADRADTSDQQPWHCPMLSLTANSPPIDACTEPALEKALEQARRSGALTVARLLREPLTPKGDGHDYMGLRWLASGPHEQAGWLALAVDAAPLFETGFLGQEQGSIAVYDISDGIEAAVQLTGEPTVLQPDESASGMHVRPFELYDFQFAVRVEDASSITAIAAFMTLGGVLSTTLITLFVGLSLRMRKRALALAAKMSSAAASSEQMLKSITDNIFEGIYRGEMDRGLTYVNPALARMFGFAKPEQMIAHAGPVLYADPEQRDDLARRLRQDGHYRDVEVEFVRPDGSHFIAVNNAVATRDEHGQVRYFDGVVYDITERKQAEQRAHHLAHYDSLTNLPNRALLDKRLRRLVEQARSTDTTLALMFLDLDNFKTINDSLGHEAGDELLKQAAARFRHTLRNDDLIARQGGDEFLIALDGADAEAADSSARRIIEAFSAPFRIQGHELRVTTSIGIAMFPTDGNSAEELVRNADAAMYAAKEDGRSTSRFYTEELNELAHRRLAMQNDLRRALEQQQLFLVYQPIIELASGRIVSAEALLRWQHPERGLVSPADFIPIAEQSGQIVAIGDWVIDQACRQLAQWDAAGLTRIRVSVNVSAIQFWRGQLLDHIQDSLQCHGIATDRLEVELTESVIMRDADTAAEIIARLRELGTPVAIDDFGTGYSSLSQLKRFQINKLKIDQSFIRDITFDPDDAAIVAAVLSIAANLRLDAIAEGVETHEQVEFLKALDCPHAQGYRFGRPMPPEEFAALLAVGHARVG
ncbi:MAG: EAL domain-containing protein [Wenzhouxiangellaceae bacterium]|nr:EAL domain-containing protein [Wenzhouxiangellaceae bacterium]